MKQRPVWGRFSWRRPQSHYLLLCPYLAVVAFVALNLASALSTVRLATLAWNAATNAAPARRCHRTCNRSTSDMQRREYGVQSHHDLPCRILTVSQPLRWSSPWMNRYFANPPPACSGCRLFAAVTETNYYQQFITQHVRSRIDSMGLRLDSFLHFSHGLGLQAKQFQSCLRQCHVSH
jgi:hypothetical protein